MRPQLPKLREQLFAVLHVGVIRLVAAEEPPYRPQFTFRLGGIHAYGYWKRAARNALRRLSFVSGRKHAAN